MENIRWTVGGGLRFYSEIINYLDDRKNFYQLKQHLIESVYDSPHGLIWQGGREPSFSSICLDEYIEMIKSYNRRGIGFNFSFSNILLKKKHLKDDLCNYALKRTEHEINGVIVASDILRNYIKKEYPKFKIKSSICRVSHDYNKLTKKHDIVTIQPDDNRKYDLIKKIKNIDKIEVLVNEEYCIKNCLYRKKHYENISTKYLEKIYLEKKYADPCLSSFNKRNSERGLLVINNHEINDLYNFGIRHFKIQGRHVGSHFIIKEMINFIEKHYIRELIKKNKWKI
jgi:collagenase-like PrtC family protease